MHIFDRLGVRRIINARSFSTKNGGAALPPEVVEAMRQASECSVRISDLQEAASAVIAEATGAEAGMVASGASAALTLGAAGIMARLDVNRMNRLPDTSGMPHEFIVHRCHRNDYDHALRVAGAKFVEVGYHYHTFPYEVEAAIGERTAGLFYQAGVDTGVVPLEEFAAIAHRHHLPVIVDAAAELPPPGNLKAFTAAGADLVAFSGGKHLRGPQASGILAGRRDLVFSAALQHQDMDVFPETWPYRKLIEDGRIAGPPHHGIGRGFKAGKEEIAGLLTAVLLYGQRDFERERRRWMEDLECVLAGVRDLAGVSARIVFPQPSGRQVPAAHIQVEDAHAVINLLQEGEPPICCSEKLAAHGTVVILPEALGPGEAAVISRRLREILAGRSAGMQ
ncbi:MAG: aminotransferase class V-fold PLP-dependent enzyme [Acidobacteria bacterium]|nr:aminotransferase class V-fold PLP-dependent enzyme [Acidobacteriota bacterium]